MSHHIQKLCHQNLQHLYHLEYIDMDDDDCAIGYRNGNFYFKGSKYAKDRNCPVIEVSWYGADAYCKWLSSKIGRYVHLPTEAQWEKAARGTDKRTYPWGNQEPNLSLANYGKNPKEALPMEVGSFPAGVSPYGVYDMAGSVWEWCSDWYRLYFGAGRSRRSKLKVCRGGGWSSLPYHTRSSQRNAYEPTTRRSDLGFRVVLEIVGM